MFIRTNKGMLSGSASWIAIVGAAFFWVWLDRGMFGSALLSSSRQDMVELATVILMIANILCFAAIYVVAARSEAWESWPVKASSLVSGMGLLGGFLCVMFRGDGDLVPFCIGGALLGCAMGYQNITWGVVAVSQGVAKTVLHISGAWGLSLFLNLAMIPLSPWAESIAVMLLPIFSLVCYRLLYRFQANERYFIAYEPRLETVQAKEKRILGVDAQFLVVILVFCGAFGFVSWFGEVPSYSSGGQAATYLAVARCAVALGFFMVCYIFSMKRVELLLRIALSLVAAGVVVLTIGMFSPVMDDPGRILVAMGYSGFDILVWTFISYYSRSSLVRAVKVIAVVMIAEQVGILLGIGSGIAVGRIGLGAFESSIFLAAMNYALLLSCFALMRRYSSYPILSEGALDNSGLSSNSDDTVERFSLGVCLTAREKEITYLLAEGRNVPYIAKKLVVSDNTVKSHVRHIYEKSGIHNRQELLDELETIRRS